MIFYQTSYGFYGIFRVADIQYPFWERLNGWLQDKLELSLIYRVLIEPLEVYKYPVTEWNAIDRIPRYSRDISWSLFYRKLKGERGCSYLFPKEYDRLIGLLKDANREGPIAGHDEPSELIWEKGEIRVQDGIGRKTYGGSTESALSYIDGRKGESHLQAWIISRINKDPDLTPILGGAPEWFANEVFVGSGMQKMDILCLRSLGGSKEFRLLELKDVKSAPEDLEQLRRYIWWIREYVWEEGDKIQPVWISRGVWDVERFKERAVQICSEEGCEELQVWQWVADGNHPRFSKL